MELYYEINWLTIINLCLKSPEKNYYLGFMNTNDKLVPIFEKFQMVNVGVKFRLVKNKIPILFWGDSLGLSTTSIDNGLKTSKYTFEILWPDEYRHLYSSLSQKSDETSLIDNFLYRLRNG